MNKRRQQVGRWGEEVAARFLEERGYRILARNLRTAYGEIDLIAYKDGLTIFVEVKARTGTGFGLPEEAITPTKRSHLINAIQAYWQEHPETPGGWQVDVIAVEGRPGGKEPRVEHYENAVTE
jgi:putative endonuclease